MYKSAYKPIAQALAAALTRQGYPVGGTTAYPRVELHTFIENTPTDKGGAVRVLSCIVESMSSRSAEQAACMNAYNLDVLGRFRYEGDFSNDFSEDFCLNRPFRVIGVVPTQLTELTETSDPQMFLYRVLQNIDIYIQQL